MHWSSMLCWPWTTYVVDQGWFAWKRSDIRKPAEDAALMKRCNVGESLKMTPIQRITPLYGTTSCARSCRWPGRPRQLSLQRLARLHRSPGKAHRRHEWVGERIWRYRCDAGEMPLCLAPASRKTASSTANHHKLDDKFAYYIHSHYYHLRARNRLYWTVRL